MATIFIPDSKIINIETATGATPGKKIIVKKSVIQILSLNFLYNFVYISANTLDIKKAFLI